MDWSIFSSVLPFSGFDLSLLAGGGLLLSALGVTLRALTRRRRAKRALLAQPAGDSGPGS